MPRTIISEEQSQRLQMVKKDTRSRQQVIDSLVQEAIAEAHALKEQEKSIVSENTTTITSEELKELFSEWDANGHLDLSVDSLLADRIAQYLQYQEELDLQRRLLAERIYKRYTTRVQYAKRIKRHIHVNNIYIGKFYIYGIRKQYKLIHVSDFKMLLIALKHPYASWISNYNDDSDDDDYVDFVSFILDNGGTVGDSTSEMFAIEVKCAKFINM